MKRNILVVLLAWVACAVWADDKEQRAGILADVYPVHFTAGPIAPDGQPDEAAWSNAPAIPFFMVPGMKAPQSPTEAKLLYDGKYLYLFFCAADRDLFATYTRRDANTWEEDVLEFFFKTDAVRPDYYEFEVSPMGTIFDAYIPRRGSTGNIKRWSDWNCKGLRAAVKLAGTPNRWEDEDEGWTLEVAVPLDRLPSLKGRGVKRGDQWRFSLARYDYSVYLAEGQELSSSSPFSAMNFHRYEEWRTLRFE